jgi:farnesyl-diphosphate farnesyltransferase
LLFSIVFAFHVVVLRGLDTIEDDMTIPKDKKVLLLRQFHTLTTQKGYTFQDNGPDEKDAILLQQYNYVVEELLKLKSKYRQVIVDVTKRMGNGMADFIEGKSVVTLEDYDLYTHYVAGLVGIGLTQLFAQSGLESVELAKHMDLANQMGLFLQKVNILKDFLTDTEEGRLFWPKSIWSLYVPIGAGPEELAKFENKNQALACLNHLCANALELVPSCLEYLSKLSHPSVFHFAAIPQVMALATFSLFYNNYDIFTKRGTKIRRGLAVKLIQQATDMNQLKRIYYQQVSEISQKARKELGRNPADKSFEKISIACANVFIN